MGSDDTDITEEVRECLEDDSEGTTDSDGADRADPLFTVDGRESPPHGGSGPNRGNSDPRDGDDGDEADDQ